jgi:divalent metal cation (Fe/Co/Zn/Cd) transporter
VARPPDESADLRAVREIGELVRERTGSEPKKVRLLSTDAGRVVFLTVAVDPGASLTEAHQLAGTLEEELRQRVSDIAEVIVHTEP